MGIFDNFRYGRAVEAADAVTAALAPLDPSAFPIASPWSPSDHLQKIVMSDIFGTNVPMNTRASAMRLGPVSRARNLMCSTVQGFPMRVLNDDDTRAAVQPAWLARVPGGSSPQHRMVWTVDDLIFYGWSCWERVTDPATGELVPGPRVNIGEWEVTADGTVRLRGVDVSADRVILIPGYHEGILAYGDDVLADAKALARIVRDRLKNPAPALELHQTAGPELTEVERTDMVAAWTAARQAENGGGVGYTSQHIELKEHGAGAGEQLMIEARNASAVDQARIVGVHAGLLDATAPKASLNYETTQGRNQEFVDFDLPLYADPITARLSLDDVTPPGTRVAFDTTEFTTLTPSPTGPTFQD